MAGSKKSIIALFEENELKVSRLYDLYSQAIVAQEKFWKKISGEEVAHANAIAEAFEDSGGKEDSFEENNFTRGIIRYISDFVDEQLVIAKNKKISHLEAVNVALRIEQSMLEKKCFEIFIPTNRKLEDVLKMLNRDTEKHVRRLQDELKKKKNKK